MVKNEHLGAMIEDGNRLLNVLYPWSARKDYAIKNQREIISNGRTSVMIMSMLNPPPGWFNLKYRPATLA